MALKKCKECGNEVSTKAKKCPSCGVNNPTVTAKEQVIGAVVLVFIIAFIVAKCTGGESVSVIYSGNKEKTLKEVRAYTSTERHKITENFMSENGIDKKFADLFYNCISHLTYTKAETMTLDTVMTLCKKEFMGNDNKFVNKYYNLDKVKDQFDPWDGSHVNLTNMVKKSMHDPDSYEHVQTKYRLVLTGDHPYIFLTSEFRGKNAFGAVIKQTVSAKADLTTGVITEINQ